jgi:hypothetical protein
MAIETLKKSVVVERAIEEPQVSFRLAGVGLVRAEEVEMTNSFAGLILAGKQATLNRAGARTLVSSGPVELTQGGAGTILSAGDVALTRGGAGALVALGDAQIKESVGGVLAAKSASVGRGGFIALAITPRLHVEQDGRVLAGAREIAALGIVTAAITVLAYLLTRLRATDPTVVVASH